tara:strand:+ start:867 stop:2309 length:1443 start_codon:yes stop_codon:yes gene_type:complete
MFINDFLRFFIFLVLLSPLVSLSNDGMEKLNSCYSELDLITKSQDKLAKNIFLLKNRFKQMNQVDEFKYAEAVNLAHVYYRQFVLLQEEALAVNCGRSRLKESGFLNGKFHFKKGELESRLLDDLIWFTWYRGVSKINSLYFESAKLRRIIQDRAKVSNLEKFIVFKFQKKLIRKKSRRHLIKRFYNIHVLYQKVKKTVMKGSLLDSLFGAILKSDISEMISTPRIDKFKKSYFSNLFKDRIYLLKKYVVNGFNSRFGNAAGEVITRNGRLYLNEKASRLVRQKLKPMDILFEKTPFILTDKTIPGHFGHVAIYIGTKNQLIELGLWDVDALKPYQKQIELGYTILEASRDGVRFKKLVDFMNVDELLILRASKSLLSYEQKVFALENSLKQHGRRYDFNFDVESISEVVCSELIFFTYPNIPWKTEEILGRQTISPDDLVKLGVNTPYLDFVLYLKGYRKSIISLGEKDLVKKLKIKNK